MSRCYESIKEQTLGIVFGGLAVSLRLAGALSAWVARPIVGLAAVADRVARGERRPLDAFGR